MENLGGYKPDGLTPEEKERLAQISDPIIRQRVEKLLGSEEARGDVSREEAQEIERLAEKPPEKPITLLAEKKVPVPAGDVDQDLAERIKQTAEKLVPAAAVSEHGPAVPEAPPREEKKEEGEEKKWLDLPEGIGDEDAEMIDAMRENYPSAKAMQDYLRGNPNVQEVLDEIPAIKEAYERARNAINAAPDKARYSEAAEFIRAQLGVMDSYAAEKSVPSQEAAPVVKEKPSAGRNIPEGIAVAPAEAKESERTVGEKIAEEKKISGKVGESVAEQELEKPEAIKKEKTPEELDFENPATRFGFGAKAKKLFNKLTDRPRGAVAALYHFYAGDRVELAYSKFWSGRHEKKAAAAQDRLDKWQREIAFADELAAGLSKRAEQLKKEHGVDVGMEAQTKSMHEIQAEKLKLEKEADIARAELEKQTLQKERFFGRRERACRKFIDVYDEQIRPLENGLGEAKSAKEKITAELKSLRERQEAMKDRLEKLEIELAEEKYPAFKKAIKKSVHEVRGNLAAGERLIRETEDGLDKYEKRIIKLNSAADEQKANRNKYARIVGLETAQVGSLSAEEKVVTAEAEATPATDEKKEPKKEIRMKLGDYVRKWNEGFAYGVFLNEEEIQKMIPPEKINEEMEVDDFEDLVMQYQEAALTAKGKQFGGKARSGIKKKIGWLEAILNVQF